MQPFHCTSDSKWLISRIGKSRARFSYPWRSLILAHVPLTFGSDSPIEDLNPWEGLEASLKRSLFPEEEISLKDAFQAYTSGAAYASFEENNRGTLTPGKWADFVSVRENPLKTHKVESLQMPVSSTFFAGQLVYLKK
jgi:predicted amidohydrolase YtcJ